MLGTKCGMGSSTSVKTIAWIIACLWLMQQDSLGCQPAVQQHDSSYCPSCGISPIYNVPSPQYSAPPAVAPVVVAPLPAAGNGLDRQQKQQSQLDAPANNDFNVTGLVENNKVMVEAISPPSPFGGLEEEGDVNLQCSTPQAYISVDSLLNCMQVEQTPFGGGQPTKNNHLVNCTFDGLQDCSFYSSPQEQIPFKQANLLPSLSSIDVSSLAGLFHRPPPPSNMSNQLPSGYFLIAHEKVGNDPRRAAILRSDIACQMGDGLLNFDYWSSYENVFLKVCTRLDRERRCTSQIVYGVESARVEVQVVHPQPSNQGPFAVEIIVSGFFQPAVFLLDNLVYEAHLCSSPAEVSPTRPNGNGQWSGEKAASLLAKKAAKALSIFSLQPGNRSLRRRVYYKASLAQPYPLVPKPTTYWHLQQPKYLKQEHSFKRSGSHTPNKLAIHRLDSCELLGCSFDQGNWCHYTQPPLLRKGQESEEGRGRAGNGRARYGKWKLASDGVFAEMFRRIPLADSGFVYVGGIDDHSKAKGRLVYTLQSSSLRLDQPSQLLFDLYQRSNAISLQVCLNHVFNCVYESPIVRTNTFWRKGQAVDLPVSTTRVLFVATQWIHNKWLAVDNIRLANCTTTL